MAKFHIEDLKKEASMLNWTLLSDEYTNLDTELKYRCPNNHEVTLSYRIWRSDKSCPVCVASQYKPVENKIAPKAGVKKRVLALDDATYDTGWAIFDDGNLIKYGLFSTKQATEVERIHTIKDWLVNMIAIWKPDFVVIEDIQLQERSTGGDTPNLTTYKVLAHLQGVLQNTLYENKVPFEAVYASVWRKSCDIKGRYRADQKRNAQIQVKKWYNIDVTNDEADAICIGRYYNKKTTPSIIVWE